MKLSTPGTRAMARKLTLALLLASPATLAFATCQDIYNPLEQDWVYECTPDPAEPHAPQCLPEYDPINKRWVEVCQ